jgi:ubiquinone/menaquinone biosynthesis C-methylase UbiE
MDQKEIFSTVEGDNYFGRNKHKLTSSDDDPVINAVAHLALHPKKILEIGCCNGWRLQLLKDIYAADCWGVDPSTEAIQTGRTEFKEVNLAEGTAEALPHASQMFDMIIYGFCLYLCDRSDLFKIAYEADRVLMELGHIVILDFHPPCQYRNPYAHHAGLYSYKMNYSQLFLWNPAYSLSYQKMFYHPPLTRGTADDLVSVMIVKKHTAGAFPDNPYKGS